MNILLHPTYFPSVSDFVLMIRANKVIFETEDNFERQTKRNRTYIYDSNGKRFLNIPVKHLKNTRQKYKDVEIDYSENWQKRHYKSLEMAYRSSPFFEYFEDDIRHLFESKPKFLLDHNLDSFEVIQSCIGYKIYPDKTTSYTKNIPENVDVIDFRYLVYGKKSVHNLVDLDGYTQVFEDKHGFLSDLSILDLLFNQGKYTFDYLKSQKLI